MKQTYPLNFKQKLFSYAKYGMSALDDILRLFILCYTNARID